MPPNQQWHCNLVLTVLVVRQFCSTFFIVIMTFERFYSIIKPHKAASFNTVKRAKITIVCIVIFSSFYNIPDLFYTGRVCFVLAKYQTTIFRNVYYWLRVIISFIVPFFSLLVMNSYIIHILRHRSVIFKSKVKVKVKVTNPNLSIMINKYILHYYWLHLPFLSYFHLCIYLG